MAASVVNLRFQAERPTESAWSPAPTQECTGACAGAHLAVDEPAPTRERIVICLVGLTGEGKSETGNTLCQDYIYDDQHFRIVDIPGQKRGFRSFRRG